MTFTSVSILDLGFGNISAFKRIYQSEQISFEIINSKEDVLQANRLIMPGVGSFDSSMKSINNSGLRSSIESAVFEKNVPLLGICVGMQVMFDHSEEGSSPGLGWLQGHVSNFTSSDQHIFTPHMGWNNFKLNSSHPIFEGISEDMYFYFLHSFYCSPDDYNDVLCSSNYYLNFASVVAKDNLIGIQFHPEKSHSQGVQILKNFSRF